MSSGKEDSLSVWISDLEAGDSVAAQKVFEHFFERLIALAKTKISDGLRRAADEEDVALSALNSFFHGAAKGRFPRLSDREDLWRLLLVITSRKAADHANRELAQKRGGGKVRGESVFLSPNQTDPQKGIDQHIPAAPSQEFFGDVVTVCEDLFESLDSPELREVARLRMEGFNDSEIAKKLLCTRSTVQRRLQLVRRIWSRELEEPSHG